MLTCVRCCLVTAPDRRFSTDRTASGSRQFADTPSPNPGFDGAQVDGVEAGPEREGPVPSGTVAAFLAEWLEVRSTLLRPASVRAYRTHPGI